MKRGFFLLALLLEGCCFTIPAGPVRSKVIETRPATGEQTERRPATDVLGSGNDSLDPNRRQRTPAKRVRR